MWSLASVKSSVYSCRWSPSFHLYCISSPFFLSTLFLSTFFFLFFSLIRGYFVCSSNHSRHQLFRPYHSPWLVYTTIILLSQIRLSYTPLLHSPHSFFFTPPSTHPLHLHHPPHPFFYPSSSTTPTPCFSFFLQPIVAKRQWFPWPLHAPQASCKSNFNVKNTSTPHRTNSEGTTRNAYFIVYFFVGFYC